MHETHLGCFSRDNENLKWCGIISVLIHCCIQKVNTGGGGTADWTAWWKGGGLWGYTFGVRFLFLLHRCLLCAVRGTALLSRVCPCCSASLLVSKQHNQLIWPLTEVLYSESQNKDFQPKYCFSQKFWATQHRLAHFLFPISQPLPSSSLTRTLCTSIYMSLATSKRTSRLLLLQTAHCTYQELHFCGDKEEPKKILIFGDLQGQVLWGWLRSVVCHLAINLHLWDSVSPVYGHTSAPLLYKPPLIQPSFSR